MTVTCIGAGLPAAIVRERDGNRKTAGDTTWLPFSTTPPYPDYTSGANGGSGSITTILALFFGTDRKTFTVTSLTAPADPKTYHRFSDMADDVVDVRIYQGIHFRFADTASRRQGTRVATHVFNHFLRPVRDRGHDHDKDCGDHDDDDDWDDHHGRGRGSR